MGVALLGVVLLLLLLLHFLLLHGGLGWVVVRVDLWDQVRVGRLLFNNFGNNVLGVLGSIGKSWLLSHYWLGPGGGNKNFGPSLFDPEGTVIRKNGEQEHN